MALITVTSAGTPVIAVVATDGKWWNTAGSPAFEAYNAANIASYATAGTQFGATTTWKITFPAGIAAGVYDVVQFKRAGASLVEGDTVEAVGTFAWDGTTLRALADADALKGKGITVDAGGTTFPASIHASGAAVAKSPATLAAGDVTGNLPSDVQTIKTQAVTCSAGVTIRADVGAAGTPGAANGMFVAGSNAATTVASWTNSGAETWGSWVIGGVAAYGQSGDGYSVVAHVEYGNAKLVRSTTPENALDVNADGEAGIDWGNIGNKTSTVALTHTTTNDPAPLTAQQTVDAIDATVPTSKTNAFGTRIPDAAAGATSGLAIVGSAMGLANGSIVTATFGTCITPETANTNKMSFIGSGPWQVNANSVAWAGTLITASILDETYGVIPAVAAVSGDWAKAGDAMTLTAAYDSAKTAAQQGTLTTLIPHAISMIQIGGTGAYYVEALRHDGSVIGTSTYSGDDTAGTTTLLGRIPHVIAMAQIGGTGPYYVLALDDAGASLPTAAEVLTALGTGSWITSAQISATVGWGGAALPTIGTSTLTAQNVRDAMKLAASAGDPAAGSIDQYLSDAATIVTDWTDGGRLDLLLDAAAGMATKFETMVVLDGAVWQFTANAVELAPGGGGGGSATLENQEIIIDHLTGIKGADWGVSDNLHLIAAGVALLEGDGVLTGVLTITDAADVPLVGALVDARSANGTLLARGQTDDNGQITTWGFNAQAVTFAAFLSEYSPNTGALTISAAGWTKTVKLTAITITPPPTPDTSTLAIYCYEQGQPKQGVTIQLQLSEMPTGTGEADRARLWEATSNVAGLVEFVGAKQLATYSVCVRGGKTVGFTTTTDAVQWLPNVFGPG